MARHGLAAPHLWFLSDNEGHGLEHIQLLQTHACLLQGCMKLGHGAGIVDPLELAIYEMLPCAQWLRGHLFYLDAKERPARNAVVQTSVACLLLLLLHMQQAATLLLGS